MTDFTEAQLEVLATATLMGRQGLGITIEPERVEDRATCDSLVESGHLATVEGVDGGYKLSDELTLAMHIVVDDKADQAAMN
jgi:hypothetical protein